MQIHIYSIKETHLDFISNGPDPLVDLIDPVEYCRERAHHENSLYTDAGVRQDLITRITML